MSILQSLGKNPPSVARDLFGAALNRVGLRRRLNAPYPVWRDSQEKPVKFAPLPKKQAVRLWHKARAFERQTRTAGKQDGAIGRNGLAILQALLFDFLNYATGALWPSRASIATKANISLRSVDRGLAALKAAGVLNWVRRCRAEWIEGRFSLAQETNAYAVLPSSQWLGFLDVIAPPKPEAGTWGEPQPVLNGMESAAVLMKDGAPPLAVVRELETDEGDELSRALARLGRALIGKTDKIETA